MHVEEVPAGSSTHYDSQRNGLLRIVIIPNDSEEAQAHRHYGSCLTATGAPRAIVPEDPQCEGIPRKGIMSAVIATSTTLTQTRFDTIREGAIFARGYSRALHNHAGQ